MTVKALLVASAAALTLAACAPATPRISVSNGEIKTNRTVNVISGGTIAGNFMTALNPDCTLAGEYKIRVTQPPASGTVTIDRKHDFTSFAPMNPRSKCNTHRVPGSRIVYHAKAGFVGTDFYSVEIFMPNGAMVTDNVNVNVR